MRAVEFETELSGKRDLHIPRKAAAQLTEAGKARVIVLVEKPSVVRLTRLVTAEKTLLRTKIGSLTAAGLAAVHNAWNQQMKL